MNLLDKLTLLDRLFPAGWTLERRKNKYSVVLLEERTQNIYAGEAKPKLLEAIDSALEKFYNNDNLYEDWGKKGVF